MQRLKALKNQLLSSPSTAITGERLRVLDNRTRKVYEVPLKEGKDCYFI